MVLQYEYQFNINDVEDMMEVYHSNGWEGRSQEDIIKIFNISTHVIIAKKDAKVVGFIRALSDGVFNAAIYDLVVHIDYQQQGIGKAMINLMLEHLGELSCVHLISTTGNEVLYEKMGFRKLKTSMAIYQNQKLKDEYTV
ncbi:GNAT family N-acetyltransferase [Staphylococcus gallinarum]|uniref:N-acetyltransferase n=1 Tax=Staphylococcus gallinarum TaxID=1293 RepID=A0A418HNW7_STAGA|nr:GNAT family N-acetyltransferase [Staphylococcus gallinarum]MCD8826298.1 GNAT family N-acetyltransferase [Staphylococcus gallinarum]PTE74948.1 GNAT family N-acetyltransferase [Staphylococcus gallinarum]RIL43159.1 N-acetyltransferase [Staphylococcus gallinarum]RIO91075.1 N-acetyltransferase [Staphylococcus gallinarum]